ncbi:sulfatase [Maribacter sp. HTCC2170]|uniref:sulfatase family protein n=1 Tax=Maribacter sp. (strain HTCC2170 / KCCM 42371) TaxID=313603 RepID=UPI00006B484A|nr:sulfatase [Maribacter sp. HTCC2170]EAR01930.1 heparan N-sulfatase [Maribacter sp. HTCC2170]
MNKSKIIFISSIAFLLIMLGCNHAKNQVESPPPNILFCIADDATFKHMSAYGSSWVKTPAFDRVAEQGLLFTNAYTPNAKCAPSRSCIVTGRNSWQLEEAGNHWSYFPTKFKTYAETLNENGYHVGLTAKGLAPTVALTENGKKRPVLGKEFNERKTTPPTNAMSNIDYAANFVDFLNEKKEDEPFCFWYGGFEPHRAYEYGSGINKGNKKLKDVDGIPDFWPEKETVKTDMLDYAYEIEYFDSHLGRMLRTLEEREMLDNTIVIVTSDNGMPFPRVKGQSYEYSNHLPLAIMWKDGVKQPGRAINDFVSFIDFAPTFLELAGIEQFESQMQPIEGRSLTDILYSENGKNILTNRDYVLIGKERHDVGRPNDWGYPIRGIRKGDYLLVLNFESDRWPAGNPETGYLNTDGGATKTQILNDRRKMGTDKYWDLCFGKRPDKELYDVVDDPYCINNLIDQPDLAETAGNLETQLIKALKKQKDPRMFGNGRVFDEYMYANKTDREFYERQMNGENPKAGWVNKTDFEPKEIIKELD